MDQALLCAQGLNLDVIILDSQDPDCDPLRIMVQIMRAGLTLRVLELNLESNDIVVLTSEHRTTQDVKDLIDAIQS